MATLKEFKPDLWDWESDPDARFFLAVIDTLADRIAAVLKDYGLTYDDVRSGKPILLPTDAPPDAKDAVRAAMTLSRAATLTQRYIAGQSAEASALVRMAFGELLIAGVLHHRIDPEVLSALEEDRRRQANEMKLRQNNSRKGKKSGEVRSAAWAPTEAAFYELRRKRPELNNRKELERLMWRHHSHLPFVEEPTPSSPLYKRICGWLGPKKRNISMNRVAGHDESPDS